MATADSAPAPAPGGEPEGWRLPRLRIDRDGDWYDDDAPITHPGLLANLRGNLRRDAGGYYIQTRVRIPVQVEDTPWVVVRVVPQGERLRVVLNDGSEEEIDPGTVRLGPGDVPYCPVKGGAFEARFSRAAAFQLLGLADYDERTGRGTLRLGGRRVTLERG
ncbi:MAG TPA: hypothetical protein VNK50_02025 [Calidithermus sp.]|nr:hypothetical protein [Calidithermus sp.]